MKISSNGERTLEYLHHKERCKVNFKFIYQLIIWYFSIEDFHDFVQKVLWKCLYQQWKTNKTDWMPTSKTSILYVAHLFFSVHFYSEFSWNIKGIIYGINFIFMKKRKIPFQSLRFLFKIKMPDLVKVEPFINISNIYDKNMQMRLFIICQIAWQ